MSVTLTVYDTCEPRFVVSRFDVIELVVESGMFGLTRVEFVVELVILDLVVVEFEKPNTIELVLLVGSIEKAYCGRTIIAATERKRKTLRSIWHNLGH